MLWSDHDSNLDFQEKLRSWHARWTIIIGGGLGLILVIVLLAKHLL
ncbi:MAG: hypothetical protein AAB364_03465 [Patescibacteria group bacterium]